MLGQTLLNLPMPRYWLAHLGIRILIPVVFPAMAYQNAARFLQVFYQIISFHAT
jgi:hypothetical protein